MADVVFHSHLAKGSTVSLHGSCVWPGDIDASIRREEPSNGQVTWPTYKSAGEVGAGDSTNQASDKHMKEGPGPCKSLELSL